ncbi:hypothetical protein HanIR_Chr08g0376461 [Helianthus annuus]|nr:hypothetical protein HanIR_Chr08g0376461 [Helianthus annuus]
MFMFWAGGHMLCIGSNTRSPLGLTNWVWAVQMMKRCEYTCNRMYGDLGKGRISSVKRHDG